MSDPADPVGAIVEYLQADAAVAARTSGRVFGGELPPGEKDNMPRAAVIVTPAGGGLLTGRGYQEYGDLRVNVICYGATIREAWLTHLETKIALKQLRRALVSTGGNSVLLHWAREAVSAPVARDPDSQWPTALGSFQVLCAEVAA